jgi:hypothetical protein
MRAQFLHVLARPLADLRALDEKLDRFREPVEVVTVALAKVDMVERALEAASLGISIAEVLVGGRCADHDDEEEGEEP